MKKICLMVVVALSTFTISFAQDQSEVNYSFKIRKLPLEIKSIDKESLSEFRGKFDNLYIQEQLPYRLFRSENILISLNERKDSLRPLRKSLAANQTLAVTRLKKDPLVTFYSSKIITVNNVSYLVIRYKKRSDELITFTSGYSNSFILLNGLIEYKIADEKKADEILKKILNEIHLQD